MTARPRTQRPLALTGDRRQMFVLAMPPVLELSRRHGVGPRPVRFITSQSPASWHDSLECGEPGRREAMWILRSAVLNGNRKPEWSLGQGFRTDRAADRSWRQKAALFYREITQSFLGRIVDSTGFPIPGSPHRLKVTSAPPDNALSPGNRQEGHRRRRTPLPRCPTNNRPPSWARNVGRAASNH
jgi:hypothetical protein